MCSIFVFLPLVISVVIGSYSSQYVQHANYSDPEVHEMRKAHPLRLVDAVLRAYGALIPIVLGVLRIIVLKTFSPRRARQQHGADCRGDIDSNASALGQRADAVQLRAGTKEHAANCWDGNKGQRVYRPPHKGLSIAELYQLFFHVVLAVVRALMYVLHQSALRGKHFMSDHVLLAASIVAGCYYEGLLWVSTLAPGIALRKAQLKSFKAQGAHSLNGESASVRTATLQGWDTSGQGQGVALSGAGWCCCGAVLVCVCVTPILVASDMFYTAKFFHAQWELGISLLLGTSFFRMVNLSFRNYGPHALQ